MSVRVRTILALALAALAVRGAAQPPTPAVGPGTTPQPGNSQIPSAFPADVKVYKLLAAKLASPIPADATPLRKIRLAQIREGGDFLKWTEPQLQIGVGFLDDDSTPFLEIIDRTYLILAELELEPARKIAMLEERVEAFKRLDQYVATRVTTQLAMPRERNYVRFRLLGAEAEVLALKNPLAKAAPAPQLPTRVGEGAATQPGGLDSYSTFPADEKVYKLLAAKLASPIPADAPSLRKVRLAQLVEGGNYLCQSRNRYNFGVAVYDFTRITDTINRTYRLFAELEQGPEVKIAVLEERVAALKEYEQSMTARVNVGQQLPHVEMHVRFLRLGAEADILALKAAPAKVGPTAGTAVPGTVPSSPPGAAQKEVLRPVDAKSPPGGLIDEKLYLLLAARAAAPIPNHATPFRKSRLAQIREGGHFLSAIQERIRPENFIFERVVQVLDVWDRMYFLLVESEPGLAGKIALMEERVVVFKAYERFMTAGVDAGREWPQTRSYVRLRRLEAEADVIVLQERLAKTSEK